MAKPKNKNELLTKSGKLKAAYGKAEEMIDALKKHKTNC